MNPATGPSSTSFKISAGGFIAGIGTLLSGLLNDPAKLTALQAQINETRTWVGGSMAALAVVFKLIHDHGFNKATLQAAGSEIVKDLPNIKAGAAGTIGFIENELPELRSTISSLTERLHTIETRVVEPVQTDVVAIRNVATQVFNERLGIPPVLAPQNPPAPAPQNTAPAPSEAAGGNVGAVDGVATP